MSEDGWEPEGEHSWAQTPGYEAPDASMDIELESESDPDRGLGLLD